MGRISTEYFDIRSYLNSRGIPFSTSGDNVSSNWIGINCLYCIDHADHLGINLLSKAFSCFKCGEKGSLIKLLQTIEGEKNLSKIYDIISAYSGGVPVIEKEKHFQSKVYLPTGSTKNFPPAHLEFLKKRRFDVSVIEKYDLYATGPIGDYKHRLIIPIYMNNRMLGFVGRDVSGKSPIPYKNSSDVYSIKDAKQCLYNVDNVPRKTVVIVEGVFDAWRIGDGAVATFGTRYTHEQLLLLRGMRRAFVMYDADANFLAHKLAHDISSIVPNVEVLELIGGDPADLTTEDVKSLRKEIKL